MLEIQLSQAFEELKVKSQDETDIRNFLELIKQKDSYTHGHSIRVALLAVKIGEFVGIDRRPLLFAGLLHDLGKLNIPDELLKKTSKWTDEELQTIRQHVIDGYEMIKGRFGFTAEVILLHHEFQEHEYPEELPLYLHNYSPETQALIFKCARVLALADVYDALHREDSKFGEKRIFSGAEVRDEMSKSNPDQRDLIENLYKEGIF
jgi:putative nucleotidyltransferase with HDIG domain